MYALRSVMRHALLSRNTAAPGPTRATRPRGLLTNARRHSNVLSGPSTVRSQSRRRSTLPSAGSTSANLSTVSSPPEQETSRISRETLHRLHRLSALNPPAIDSEEERTLLSELSELVSLMDQVKTVELPSSRTERAELLAEGVGQVVISQETMEDVDLRRDTTISSAGSGAERVESTLGEKRGKELLGWATNRVGDYYASKNKAK
ncbi:hypothetical protein IAU60_003628 [Kwoniella sp. DSM 27419]